MRKARAMNSLSRRGLLRGGLAGLGLAAAGGARLLADEAVATADTPDLHDYLGFLREYSPEHGATLSTEQPATPKQILGPYHRPGAPFRGKVTPPLEPGRVLLVHGRVWGLDTRQPLAGAALDVWQANAAGQYDMSHPDYPLEKGVFYYRTRLVADESGYYEFETVYPGRYEVGQETFRPAHIHYWIKHPGYRELITQLYFEGDPWNEKERGLDFSLVRPVNQHHRGDQTWESCDFDIVLAKA
jgi:catechol 1,2-dioxygenase